MDGWPPEHQRHHNKACLLLSFPHLHSAGKPNSIPQKRTTSPEMSQHSTVSPSSIFSYQNPSLSNYPQYRPAVSSFDRASQSFGRRRTVHPHNPPMRRFHRSPEDMSQTTRLPPRLQHRASETLTIDLTDENDDVPEEDTRSQRRSPAGRNSGVETNIIDLTNDNEVEITRIAPRPLPSIGDMDLNALPPARHRPLFLPQEPPRNINRVFPTHNPLHRGFHITAGGQGEIIFHPSPDFLEHIQMLEDAQAIVGQMDLQPQNGAPSHSRPDHVPPPPAMDGFTRSPTEKDVVICPSCEEELIHDKKPDELVVKKGGKAPTRKEREEHPFWVVKNCGHVGVLSTYVCALANLIQVYCNRCYQNRLPSKQQPAAVHFREKASTARGLKGMVPLCSVEECQSEVKNKDRWVGVFL